MNTRSLSEQLSFLSMMISIPCTILSGLCLLPAVYAKALWATEPANNFTDIIRTAYPVGNGQLAGRVCIYSDSFRLLIRLQHYLLVTLDMRNSA